MWLETAKLTLNSSTTQLYEARSAKFKSCVFPSSYLICLIILYNCVNNYNCVLVLNVGTVLLTSICCNSRVLRYDLVLCNVSFLCFLCRHTRGQLYNDATHAVISLTIHSNYSWYLEQTAPNNIHLYFLPTKTSPSMPYCGSCRQ